MDRDRLSALAHTDHPIASPLSDATVDRLIDLLAPPATVLDVGCGGGEWLLRILERHPEARGVGVDRSPYAIERAQQQAQRRLAPGRLRLLQQPVEVFVPDPDGYDAVLCVGSTHIYGGLGPALAALRGLAHRQALIGEGFWARPPGAEALAALGAEPDEFGDLDATLWRCRAAGFEVLHAHVSSLQEWDAYEEAWVGPLERHEEYRGLAHQHRGEYWQGYRGTLGYLTALLEVG
jgi:SAM-dependent methyltransferase